VFCQANLLVLICTLADGYVVWRTAPLFLDGGCAAVDGIGDSYWLGKIDDFVTTVFDLQMLP
jgi:hypothetical protein